LRPVFAPDFAQPVFAGSGSLITAIGAPPAVSEPTVQVTVVIVGDSVIGREFRALDQHAPPPWCPLPRP
jgi:hypothetical protein